MKVLQICGLLTLLVVSSFCCDKRPDLSKKTKNGVVTIDLINNKPLLTIKKVDGTKMQNVLITRNPAKNNTAKLTIKDCVAGDSLTSCIMSGDVPYVKIKIDPDKDVVEVTREVNDPGGEIMDCYQLGKDGTQWVGGPEIRLQQWPIQDMYYEDVPYVTTAVKNMAIAERYWLSSRGIYLYVKEDAPLFIDQNNEKMNHLCLVAKNKAPYHKRDRITLKYEIGVFKDPKTAHKNVIAQHFGKPTGHPNQIMVEHPIWSTWAIYKVHINEMKILQLAQDIRKNNFSNSQIEIDDHWETCYGSATFDPVKFPDVPRLVQQLKELGFDATLWIHPFINEDCEESYIEALDKGYFVKNEKGSVRATWWQGQKGAGAIDFTNKEAVEWWVGRLKKIEALGIKSFKFDAGEMSWLPQIPQLNASEELQPGIYTSAYTSMLAERFNDRIEVRGGFRTQELPIFVRFQDKDSKYSWENGLPTLVTTLLQMNLNGYVFVLPDMIGGNGYVGDSFEFTALPPKDMFIRWLQANTFMPSIQFSFVPWQYDEETIAISKKFTKLHLELAPKIVKLMERAVATGEPINPPIWWVDPYNVEAHKIYDEFLLGEEFLVAPILEEDTMQRDIYLPAGKWRDGNTNKVHRGPTWLKNYPVPLDTLPYFKKE